MSGPSQRVMNLSHLLRQRARRSPNQPALIRGETTVSWAELDARVDALANGLRTLDVRKADPVIVQARNGCEIVEALFACFRIGAVFAPVNFRQAPAEVAALAASCGARAMLFQTEFAPHAAAVRESGVNLFIEIGEAGSNSAYDKLIAEQTPGEAQTADVVYHDPCWFFFTSGSTGRPKAAVLTHGQMAFVVVNHICDLMPGLNEGDVSLVVAPLSHGAGIHLLTQIARGAPSLLPSGDGLDPDEVWGLVQRWRVTNLFTVPTIVKMLVEHPSVDLYDHTSLRYLIYAGAPMYREDQKRALAKLGPVLVQYFGLGEVTGAITVLRSSDHSPEDHPGVKIATCGRERTGMQVEIQDGAGQALGAGDIGEICVCGPAVFKGYHNNPDADAAAFRDGWFRTGDLGFLDPEGDLFITGRASDMYISGGSNVYPREIEDLILAHPAVQEAAVVGVPDSRWGEVGLCGCVLRPGAVLTEPDLLQWLGERLARYKLPKRIMVLDALPKSAYGKIARADLKQTLVAG